MVRLAFDVQIESGTQFAIANQYPKLSLLKPVKMIDLTLKQKRDAMTRPA